MNNFDNFLKIKYSYNFLVNFEVFVINYSVNNVKRNV